MLKKILTGFEWFFEIFGLFRKKNDALLFEEPDFACKKKWRKLVMKNYSCICFYKFTPSVEQKVDFKKKSNKGDSEY